jgi:threonine dehydratase
LSATQHVQAIPLRDICAAQNRIKSAVVRTPLVRLSQSPADPAEIYLKLENLQPVGSFKLRGAVNAIRQYSKEQLEDGVWTVSAGNMAQGLAWSARQVGVKCTAIVPDTAPETKLANIRRLGADYIKVSFDEFEETIVTRRREGLNGLLIHPFSDPAVMAGNGTIGLEILEDLPDVDTVVIAYAGGGLSCGIASAIRALKPEVKLYAAEVETGAPFAASLAAGRPVRVDHRPSFVDGISGSRVFDEMWPLASRLLDGSLVVTLEETASTVKLMVERNHTIAEGAGAVPVAAALAGKAGGGKIACVVSGGNIEPEKLVKILQGLTP